jgi:hypothetical protein
MEIQPYEAEAIIANLVKSWINIRVDRLAELVDRILQQEVCQILLLMDKSLISLLLFVAFMMV